MSRKQRYSLKPIRLDYTYSVDEIAELYDLTRDTVLRWIRDDGLKRISGSKKYFVHSSDLIAFLEKRNRKNKRPYRVGEIYCCKCGKPQKLFQSSLIIERQPNRTIRVKGKCSSCATRMNTYVSGKNWSIEHPFHPDRDTPTTAHSGAQGSPRECQTKEGDQLCLNITQ